MPSSALLHADRRFRRLHLPPGARSGPVQLLWLIGALFLSACTTPGQALQQQAQTLGLEPLLLRGEPFNHQSYYHSGVGGRLHVYLEGDGKPWTRPTRVATDPTSRDPLLLPMMALDPAPALYLGRPCYNGQAADRNCQRRWWTGDRYSATVVNSLAAALHQFVRRRQFDQLLLIGHSGGGTLAMLLAPRLQQTQGVVTLAANLDIDRWVALHRYTPLRGSLNPRQQPPLPATVRQLHFVGRRDKNVPLALSVDSLANQPAAELIILEDFDHRCCWLERWPQLLARITAALPVKPAMVNNPVKPAMVNSPVKPAMEYTPFTPAAVTEPGKPVNADAALK